MIKLIFLFSKNTLNCLKVSVKTFIILQSISISNISHLNAVLFELSIHQKRRDGGSQTSGRAGDGSAACGSIFTLAHTARLWRPDSPLKQKKSHSPTHWLLRPGMHPHRQKFRIQHTVALNPHVKHKNDTAEEKGREEKRRTGGKGKEEEGEERERAREKQQRQRQGRSDKNK